MGYYLNKLENGELLPAKGKTEVLIKAKGAVKLAEPTIWSEGIVCVIENAFFDGAAYIYSQSELDEFKFDESGRKKTWLLVSNADVLSGFKEA